jgi:hypothetical protein
MIALALACSLLALISGLLAIGSGVDFHFTPRDILRGRENALAYVWVVCSTIFTIAHTAVLGFWALLNGLFYVGPHTNMWMPLHAGMGILFFTAHLFIKHKLIVSRGLEPVYLWGNR